MFVGWLQSYNVCVTAESRRLHRERRSRRNKIMEQPGTTPEIVPSSIRSNDRNSSRALSGIVRACLRFALVLLAAVLGLSNAAAVAQEVSPQPPSHAAIRGVVRDSAGKPVGEASVRLEQKGVTGAIETKTKADGTFAFSALGTGSFILRAEKAGLRSRVASVVTSSLDNQRQVDLTLENSEAVETDSHASSSSSTPAMEFADAPNFTVAAVTDWTAVGGHGSDSSLRTSEALTRETLNLKAQGARLSAGDSSGGGSTMTPHTEDADRHRTAGELAEKQGDPLAAVREYQQAVREDPSEQNYFKWGSELLVHRAVLQAKDVFAAGAKLYPESERMLTALGAALFAGAFYDESALRLCDASNLNPADPEPYIFMGKIEIAAPNPLPCVEQKLARFVQQQPGDALANYFYAMAVWKQQGESADAKVLQQVEAMLTKAVTIDPKCGDAYLQLGVLNSSQRKYVTAIDYYSKAIEANPDLRGAHYRLGVAYDRIGDHAKAKQEFQLHAEVEKQQAAEVERQRKEVKQFLVVVQEKPADPAVH